MSDTTDALLRPFTSYGNAMYRNDPDAAELIAAKFAAALAQAGAPDGWQLVPAEPNADQIMAAARAAKRYMDECGGNSPAMIYRAMLAAAPKPEDS